MTRRGTDQEDAWLTVPNVVTLVRLLLVVPIGVLILEDSNPVLTVVLLAVFAASDWVDGFLARRLGQTSRLGAALDPVADRLGVACIGIAFVLAGHLELWVALTIATVDVVLAVAYLVMRPVRAPRVTWLGKARTVVLMTALVSIGIGLVPGLEIAAGVGAALSFIGAPLHGLAGAGYLRAMAEATPR